MTADRNCPTGWYVEVMKAEIIDPAEPQGEGPNNATA